MRKFSGFLAVVLALAFVFAGAEALAFGDMSKPKGGTGGKAASVDKTPVEKAKGPDSYTVAEIYMKSAELDKKNVVVRGRVTKVSAGIMGKNWVHLQDGSGDAEKGTHDLVATSQDLPAVGETWRVDKDIELPNDEGTIGVHVGYKLARVSNSGGHRTAAIQETFNIPTTLAAARDGYIVDATSNFDGTFEGVISLEDGTMERGRLKATQTGNGLTHISGFGLPFVHSSMKFEVETQIVKLAQQRAV